MIADVHKNQSIQIYTQWAKLFVLELYLISFSISTEKLRATQVRFNCSFLPTYKEHLKRSQHTQNSKKIFFFRKRKINGQ